MAVGEWDQRQLCPDGGCIGVIGPDGTCKVCGHAAPNWGDERNRGLAPEEPEDEEDDEDEEDEELAGESGEWPERKLCPDGSCIGVLGDDGKCKVCGRSAA